MIPNKSDNRTLDQKRAEYALQKVKEIEKQKYGHYVSYVSALPATIVMNGLGQALVTLLAKAKSNPNDPHRMLYNHVAGWLSEQIPGLNGGSDHVIEKIMENNQSVYLRAQTEAIAYLNWLKQFARAYLNDEEGKNE